MAFEWIAGPCGIVAASDLQDSNLCNLSKWVQPVVGVVITTVAVVLLASRFGHQQERKLPPGPLSLPVIGALLSGTLLQTYVIGLHKAFDKLVAKYGPIVHLRFAAQTIVLVSSAELAEEVLKQKDAEFANKATIMTRIKAKYLGMDSAVFTFADYDAPTKLGRKIAMTEFFSGAKLKSYEELRGKEVTVMVEKILLKIDSSAADLKRDRRNHSDIAAASCTTVEIRQAAVAMVRNIICTLCVGKRFDDLPVTDEFHEFPQLLDDHFKLLMTSYVMEFLPVLESLEFGILKDLKKFKKRQEEFFERLVERQRQKRLRNKLTSGSGISTDDNEPSSKNFVDVLLHFQEEGGQMSDKGIRAMVLTILMASIHTISSQIEWVLLELVRHPKLLERLQAEIDGVVGKERAVQEADLEGMPFLKAVVLETLRLHPVVQTTPPHVNTRPMTIGGYYIPSNTAMIVNIRSIARDPKKWRDPLQFNPDRFMAVGSSEADPALSSESRSANGSNFHLLPFGSGRRMCPGHSLAMVTLSRMLATFVHALDLSPPPGCCADDLSIEEGLSYILHPQPDLLLTCTPRLSRHVYKSNISQVKLV